MNTKNSGHIRVLVYRQAPKKYVGVVFELGIVEEGKDAEMLYYNVLGTAKDFLRYIREKKLPDHNLNKAVDNSFERKWREALAKAAARKTDGIFANIPLRDLQHA